MIEKQTPSQDDKIVSALAHAAALLPFWGVVVPVLIWVTQREKSDYIRQQSLQAMAWQLLQICLFFVGMIAYVGSFFLVFGGVFLMETQTLPSDAPPPGFFFPFCIFGFIFLGFFITIIIALYAAVRNLQGQRYFYPLVGRRVEAYLSK